MKKVVIIPARLASTRLPQKVLADIVGIPMIVRVASQVLKSSIKDVFVACDSEKIAHVVSSYGIKTILTDENLPSGTDRVFQAYQKLGRSYDLIVNVQGDLPLLDPISMVRPKKLDYLCNLLWKSDFDIATFATPIKTLEEINNPNVVKPVISFIKKNYGQALYFSRSPVPYSKTLNYTYYHHIGIYVYKQKALEKFVSLKPSILEKRESLEQLRALENNMKIVVKITNSYPLGVDTKEDLQKVISLLKK
jgi:3-deoxy-manno-octulosonate cytidylyltransferase (CMP-KDO synthetase)